MTGVLLFPQGCQGFRQDQLFLEFHSVPPTDQGIHGQAIRNSATESKICIELKLDLVALVVHPSQIIVGGDRYTACLGFVVYHDQFFFSLVEPDIVDPAVEDNV